MTKRRPNNSGSYQQRGNRHIIQWTENGKRLTKSYPTELEARAALQSVGNVSKLQTNRTKSQTIQELFTTWINTRPPSPTNYGYMVRFNKHWTELIGNYKPNELNVAILKVAIADFHLKGLSNSSIGLLFRILSSFMSELLENGQIDQNPVSLLSKKTRKDFISKKDPSKIPFIKKIEDISRIYTWLNGQNKSVSVAFAIGALAGLRLNEIRALSWEDVDFTNRLLHIRWQASESRYGADCLTAPKNKLGRDVPISDSLYDILQKWFESTRGEGWVIRAPYSPDVHKKFIGKGTLRDTLKRCLKVLKINKCTWYGATRHTFASQWVINNGSLVKLKEIMGHASFSTTEQSYIHLVPGKYSDIDRKVIQVELKDYEKAKDWKLLEIDSKLRGDLLPSDGHWNERDSRPNGQ